MSTQTEQLNLKLEKDLYTEIELVSKVLHVPKNEWARGILAHEVKKELEEHKTFLVRDYFKGKISRQKLVNILGEKEVSDIDNVAKIGKKSFSDATKLAKAMK